MSIIGTLLKSWKDLGSTAHIAGLMILLFESVVICGLFGFAVYYMIQGSQSRECIEAILALAFGFCSLFAITAKFYPSIAKQGKGKGRSSSIIIAIFVSIAILAMPPRTYSVQLADAMAVPVNGTAIDGADALSGSVVFIAVNSQSEADAASQIIANGGWLPEWGPQPLSLPCIIVVLVVVVGVIVVYKLVDFCKAHFPPPSTNQPPAGSVSAAGILGYSPTSITTGDTNTYVALFPVSANADGNIFPQGSALDSLNLFSVGYNMDTNGAISMKNIVPIPDSAQVTQSEFWNSLKVGYGLPLPASAGSMEIGSGYYSCNGMPTSNSPISIVNGKVVVNYGSASSVVPAVLERSYDLRAWTPVYTNNVQRGQSIQMDVYEPPTGCVYYRTRYVNN